jgi:hypothetical protein
MPDFASCVLVPSVFLVSNTVTHSVVSLVNQWHFYYRKTKELQDFRRSSSCFLELHLTPKQSDKHDGMYLTSVRWSWLKYGLKCTATGWVDLYSRQLFHVLKVTRIFACQLQTRKGLVLTAIARRYFYMDFLQGKYCAEDDVVTWLVEALFFKPEGSGFFSR